MMHLLLEITILTFVLEISFATPQEVNQEVCVYGENCESCSCDINRCLICSSDSYCVCFEGMHYDEYNSSCVLSNNLEIADIKCPDNPRDYGERCTNSIPNCRFCAGDLECIDGMCNCKQGAFYKMSEKKCYVYPGEDCQNSICMENSHCVDGKCKCRKPFLQDNHKCLLGYNATCRKYHKCHRGVHLECIKSVTIVPERKKKNRKFNSWKCKCIDEGKMFVWSKNQERCIALHGTRCDKDKNDCIINSACNPHSSRCECMEGFAPVNNRCLQKCNGRYRNKNTTTENCGQFKVCKNNVCSCELRQMVYDDCGECQMPLGHKCGNESKNYTCDIGLICSSTCGKCAFPDSPPCTSSGGYLSILISTALVSLMVLVTS